MDVYLMIRPWNRLTEEARVNGEKDTHPRSNHMGDIIEVRPATMDPWSTPTERTKFYFLKVTGIPNAKAKKFAERLLEQETTGDALDGTRQNLRPRLRGLCGPDVTPAKAKAWIEARFGPAVLGNLRAYFNGTTEQPESAVLSVTYAKFKAKVWNKTSSGYVTDAELEE